MIDADQAKTLVLSRSEAAAQFKDRFAVQSCTLSAKADYWIIRVNSEDFVLRGIQARRYVGANAHLVNTVSGEIETVGSGQSVDQYLEDKYDLVAAAGMHYVLHPGFDKSDKAGIINLRQKLECSMQRAIQLVSPVSCCWLTGRRRTLAHAQALLLHEEIATSIQLQPDPGSAMKIDDSVWHWSALKSVLNRLEAR